MSKTVQYEKNTVKQHEGQDSRFGMPIYSSYTIQNVQNHRQKIRQIPMVWLQQVQKRTYVLKISLWWNSWMNAITSTKSLCRSVERNTWKPLGLKIAPVISCALLASQLSCPDIQGSMPSFCSITPLCTTACRILQWCLWFLLYPPIQCHSPMTWKCCR